MNLFELYAKLGLDSTDYEAGMGKAQNSLGKFEKLLKTFVTGYAVKKFVGLAQDAVAVGMAFDSSMSQVAATMGTTVDEIGELRDFAQKMGATTKFSAVEAAQALNYMALAGYDAKKSMQMLPTVLNLAAAGGFDLARASDMVTDAESALGLTTEQTAKMVDQMARTASRSNTSVEQLGDAMLTIGGTAKFMAGGTDRLQTVLGLLADNGIKGSEAGTKLRNMITKLASPTEAGAKAIAEMGVSIFDAEGNMRDFRDIFLDLNKAMSSWSDEKRLQTISDLFNARDAAAVNALLGTTKERWEELGGAIAEASGAAGEMADTQLGNLSGDITIMKSALEGVKIQFSDGITPALREVIQRLSKALSSPKTQKFLNDVGKALGTVIKHISNIVRRSVLPFLISLFENGAKKLKVLVGVVGGAIVAFKALNLVMGVMSGAASPLGLILKGVGLLVGVFGAASLASDVYKDSLMYLNDEQRELVDSIEDMAETKRDTDQAYKDSAFAILRERDASQDLWKELQTLVDEDGKVKEGHEDRANFILGELNEALGTEIKMNGGVIESYQKIQKEIDKTIRKRAAEALLDAGKDKYTQALQGREKALQNAADAYAEMQQAQADYNRESILQERLFRESAEAYERGDYAAASSLDSAARASLDRMEKAKLALDEFSLKYEEANETAKGYYSDISRYEQAQIELSKGHTKKAIALLSEEFAASLEYFASKKQLSEQEKAEYLERLKSQRGFVEQYARNLKEGAEGFTKEGLKAAREELSKFEEVGRNMGLAIGDGMNGVLTTVAKMARSFVRNAVIGPMKNEAQIASPSKVGRGIGANIGGSVGMGIDDSYDSVIGSAEGLSNGVLSALDTMPDAGVSVETGAGGGTTDQLIGLLTEIRDKLGFDVVLDDGTLVGRIDKALGRRTLARARGN